MTIKISMVVATAAIVASGGVAHGAAMLEVNGLVTEKTAGWRFEASE
jgi:hypothetical protein